jgi:hypothetical protein
MKHFVTISLLAVVLSTAGCLGYRPVTSSSYTSYYSAYDWYNHCYYHPSRYYVCCGSGPGYGYIGWRGDGHSRSGGGASSTFNGGTVQHPGGSHRSGGSGGSGRSGGGGGHHSSGSGGHHSSGSHSHSRSSNSSHK